MQIEELIDYWEKRSNYLLDELYNLADIYKERSNEFSLDEAQKHREMVSKCENQYEVIQATIIVLYKYLWESEDDFQWT